MKSKMSEWNTQVIWLQLVVIMILALWLTEAKDNGKKMSPYKTCKIINHNFIKNWETKHFAEI